VRKQLKCGNAPRKSFERFKRQNTGGTYDDRGKKEKHTAMLDMPQKAPRMEESISNGLSWRAV
jgi:hypothetical protein